jgi:hypothetical protein
MVVKHVACLKIKLAMNFFLFHVVIRKKIQFLHSIIMKNNDYKVETMQLHFKKLGDKQNYIYICISGAFFPVMLFQLLLFPTFIKHFRSLFSMVLGVSIPTCPNPLTKQSGQRF